jgi:DNA-binding CsgD family transcriptional regulator/outer membrane murein-binding lipoprotein Lpp
MWRQARRCAIARTYDVRDREDLGVVTTTDVREPASPRTLVALFALMAVMVGIDLVTDLSARTTLAHVLLELAVVVIGFVAATSIALRLRRSARAAQELRAQAAQLAEDLRMTREEAAGWRRDAADLIAGLSAAIDAQFVRWQLSPAETEIALLLLKGLSHKEIAQIRSVSETTVRQQARSLYRKAGLGGRNDLAAFFLEDLLGPRERSPAEARAATG